MAIDMTNGGHKPVTIALAGNPNSGKTTIFNALTGSRHHVGNYPGVTVEVEEGSFRHKGHEVTVVDLPGTYSLTAHSADELVARNYVMHEDPDVVVCVLDSSNLERHLYLAVQFMELEVPVVLAFNMSDIAGAKGQDIDTSLLSRFFDARIVSLVGHKGVGLEVLKDTIVEVSDQEHPRKPTYISYGREVEAELSRLIPRLEETSLDYGIHPRWLAIKLLEGDESVTTYVKDVCGESSDVLSELGKSVNRINVHFGDTPEVVIADGRYGFISGACQEAVNMTVETRHSMSDRIDELLTSNILGIPIFLGLMYLLFKMTFTMGEYPMVWIENLFSWISSTVVQSWPEGVADPMRSLIVDGVIAGVGGVLVFVPTIVLLFFAIALLEDSGYMARAAFIMDGLMHKIGLHGKSFIPMLIGFGCTVPAIMATRMLESRRDRLSTMLVLPLFSCGARLPIYTLFIGAFFADKWRTPMLMMIYLIGIAIAVILARLLRATLFKGEAEALVMDLPPYRLPTFKGLMEHTWDRAWLFVRKAGTVIVVISMILWVLTSYPKPGEDKLEGLNAEDAAQVELSYSVAGRIGKSFEPVMKPVGFDWKTTTALIGAVAAKEVFVAQLGIVNSLGEGGATSEPLREVLRRQYSPLQAFCIMLFCLISVPCAVTVVATWKESGAWYWAALQAVGLTLLAYIITFIVYQGGMLIGKVV
ncbi:MAG: ferrous iron transport protein B [Kiritimatiellia bacterium]|nr:ferrous iron transport protein B [Kiritimatiellia bacterium]